MLDAFSGKGLVPSAVVADAAFPAAVALAAGTTVLLATRLGFPISTTHALIGALLGAGLVAPGSSIDSSTLAGGFLLSLLTSPLIAVVLAAALHPVLRKTRRWLGVSRETCVCIGQEVVAVVPGTPGVARALEIASLPTVTLASEATCRVRYRGRLFGVGMGQTLDIAHYLSAGAVSFARGLNDTPKIAALLLVANALAPSTAIVGVGATMVVGGLLSSRRVAEMMSQRVTEMNPGQGLAANLVTSSLVIGATMLGVPVSTTHVSCGSLFGIGMVTGQAKYRTIFAILLAWGITLPVAGILGAVLAEVLALL